MMVLRRFDSVALCLFALGAAVSMLTPVHTAGAHEVRPAYLQIDHLGGDRFSVLWRTPLLAGTQRLPVIVQFPDGVRNVTEPTEQHLADSMIERQVIESHGGLAGKQIRFVGLQTTITDVFARVQLKDGSITTSKVRPAEPWLVIPARQSSLQVAMVFVATGIKHILFGFDHLLFVASLMLIVRRWGMLLKTVTAFTIAHSITLTCAALGWVRLPPGPVEVMIAFSIVLVAAEIIRMERGGMSLANRWPWIVAFCFGLLHGFGFASALAEFGLPQGDIPLALFSFNVGVELGQLMFIGVLLASVMLVRCLVALPKYAAAAAAYAIGIPAAVWTIERLASTFA